MNRLQKKCFIVSAGFHLFLALLLVIGPAFLSSKSRLEDMPVIDFVPSKLVDAAVMGGGSPKAQPPSPAPPVPAPVVVQPSPPPPQKVRDPDPPKDIAKHTKPDPDSLEMAKEHKPKLPQVSTKLVTHKTESPKTSKQPSASDTREREAAEARRHKADLIAKTAHNLKPSAGTTIDMNDGPGGGGEAYANYAQFVKTVYTQAWVPPEDSANDDAITKVTVTIRNDGKVIAARIIRRSGETQVDGSVQRTLDRVSFIAPFPEGAKEKDRTYTINFNLKAKRLLG